MPRDSHPASDPAPAARRAAMARLRLRHLQCFLAVAQSGSLRAAAQALSVTQPAITKTLHELEEIVAAPLFVRGRRGAALTVEGQAFLAHANTSVSALEQAIDSVRNDPAETPLAIGMLPTMGPSFVPAALRGFVQQWPGAALRVHTGRNRQLIQMLREREIDLVVGRLAEPDVMVGVNFEHLYTEPLTVVLRKGHPFLKRHAAGKAALSGLADLPLVVPLAGTIIRQVADAFLVRHAIVPRAGLVETLDVPLARALVADAGHAWLTSEGAARPDLADGRMQRLAVSITPEEPVGLMLRTDFVAPPLLQALIGELRQEAERRRPAGRARRRGVR